MARVASHPISDKKPKIAERIAFQPFTSQQDLINELIRNMINPDNDIGRSYYVGEVTKIIEDSSILIDNRDIFYSLTDNSQRATKKDTNDQQYNTDRVILLVHIPSFITSNKTSTYDLNYDNFLKLRVEYDQKNGAIKVGNVVKIQFHKQNALYFPVVVDVVDVSLEDIEKRSNKAKEEFSKYQECKLLGIDASNKIGSNDFDISNRPFGGYVQAIQEIENIFSPSFVEPFKRNLNPAIYGSPAKITIEIRKISINGDALSALKTNITSNKVFAFSNEDSQTYSNKKQDYLILGKEVIIVSDPEKTKNNPNLDNQLRKEFFDFLKKDFNSRLGYSFTDEQLPQGIDFELNINAFLSYGGNQAPSLKMYIDKSKKTATSPMFYSKIPTPNSSPQIIQQKNTIDKCDNELPTDNRLYSLIYDGKFNVNHNTIDDNIIRLFYEDKVKHSDFINNNYFLKLANANLKNINDLFNLNKTFYIKNNYGKQDEYGITKNSVGIGYIEDKLKILINFLNLMQNRIWENEKNATPDIILDDVLIVPRQVLKIKKGIVSQDEDPNSRHYYGKAVDIAVYLKIKENNEKMIRQIRPEIVLLYAEKCKKDAGIDVLGHGLFLEQQSKYYNHIEILTIGQETTRKKNEKGNNFSVLTQNDRFFTGNLTDIEKQLEGQINKLAELKRIISLSQQFKNPIPPNEIDKRFQYLISG